jgi:hypothetical protein
MNEYDPTELLAFCDAILEDCEVSFEEVYSLAEWLNANPTACDHWPGNLLIEPLQTMWADGKTTKTELRSFTRILTGIQKQRVKQERERAKQEARASSEAAIAAAHDGFDPGSPWVPPIEVTVTEQSQSEPGVVYHVDLGRQTCTCPDWNGVRQRLPVGSPSRFCKHMFSALGKVSPSRDWPSWLGYLVDHGRRLSPRSRLGVVKREGGAVLLCVGEGEWCDVIAPESGSYSLFGFNRVQNRWSYGEAPKGAMEIRKAIGHLCS